jgi:cytochrome bd-type quinol oxidase subunit 2
VAVGGVNIVIFCHQFLLPRAREPRNALVVLFSLVGCWRSFKRLLRKQAVQAFYRCLLTIAFLRHNLRLLYPSMSRRTCVDLTIENTSSPYTLKLLTIITLVFLPIVRLRVGLIKVFGRVSGETKD